MSNPHFGELFTFTQPDGSQFQVHVWGDQYDAVFESTDGFRVIKDPVTGFYQYATVTDDGVQATGVRVGMLDPTRLGASRLTDPTPSAARGRAEASAEGSEDGSPEVSIEGNAGLPRSTTRWQQRREEARIAARIIAAARGATRLPPQRQTIGAYVGLCLLIDFPDVRGTISKQEVESFCNQPGYAGFGNNGSVYDYFYEISGGKFQYTNIVAPYYTARHPKAYYTNPAITYPVRAQQLIQEAVAYLRRNGFDFSRLTADSQGFIYAMSVFYAGGVDNNWSEGLWPHAYRLPRAIGVAPGKSLFDYQVTNMGNELTLGTFCHENGHMVCDFPDLYDYANDGLKSQGAGRYCLMAAGANVAPKNPTQVSAYLKYKAGWAKQVTPITATINATIQAGENDFYLYRKSPTEYFIIENRFQQGRDKALTDSGLAIWHVDELGNNEHGQMTPALHYECALVQADNQFHLEKPGNLGNRGDAHDLFEAGSNERFDDNSAPHSKWWDGSKSRLKLSNIGPRGLSMSFAAGVVSAFGPRPLPVAPSVEGTARPIAASHAHNGEHAATAQWTFMIYLAGDNNLESFGLTDLGEMQSIGSTRDVQIVAQFDSMAGRITRRYHLKANSSLADDCVQELDEVNTGDPDSLYEFVEWATHKYPAQHYALVLWNHGSGWKDDDIYRIARSRGVADRIARGQVRSITGSKLRRALFRTTIETIVEEMARRAILFDDTDADFLDSVEMRAVLDRITTLLGRPLDLLGFDACLMSMLEVFYQVRAGCEVAVGSQELEPGDGWPYHLVLDALVNDPTMVAETLAETIVDTYIGFYQGVNPPPVVTQSAVRMAKLRNVAEAVSRLGQHFADNLNTGNVRAQMSDAIRYAQTFDDTDYLDLLDFCQVLTDNDQNGTTGDAARAVLAALEEGQTPIIAARNSGGAVERANGLSIYLPERTLSGLYQNLDFAQDWQWDNFLSTFHTRRADRREPQRRREPQ